MCTNCIHYRNENGREYCALCNKSCINCEERYICKRELSERDITQLTRLQEQLSAIAERYEREGKNKYTEFNNGTIIDNIDTCIASLECILQEYYK